MFQLQAAEAKDRSKATRTVPKAEPQRELHPYSHIGAGLREFGSGAARHREHLAGLQSMIGNQAVLRMLSSSKPVIQTKLAVNQPGDPFEQEADRVAEHVMSATPVPTVQRSCSSCAGEDKLQRECAECEEGKKLTRKAAGPGSRQTVPPIVHQVLRSPGQPLDASARGYMESRFQTDFSRVRVHTDARASESARAVNASAYTVGKNLVFALGQYQPASRRGMKLLAHELTHVVQQADMGRTPRMQRQLITPLAAGGGFGGLMERDRIATTGGGAGGAAGSPIQVCSRPLQSVLGAFFNHAFIQAPPYRYAVISPLCKATDGGSDNVIQGTVGQKWDNSPDPCGKTPVNCVACRPKPGVSDVASCLRNVFLAYNSPNLYKATGPNSNTFAGTLARACCDGMVPQPPVFGTVPGWGDSPAPPRAGICPPGPTC